MNVDIKLAFAITAKDDTVCRKLISWWTKSKYFHVDICINGRWVSAYGDVLETNLLSPNGGTFDYIDIPTKITSEQYQQLNRWLDAVDGSGYDYLGIFLSTIIRARVDNPRKWFCSEVATKILQLLLVEKTYTLTPNMVTPGKLAKIFGVES